MQLPRKLIFLLSCFIFVFQYSFSQYIPFFEKGKWGFASTSGRITIPCIYDEVSFFSGDNLAKVRKAGKYGYINKIGEVVIPIVYDNCDRNYETYRYDVGEGTDAKPSIHLNQECSNFGETVYRYMVTKNKKTGVLLVENGVPKEIIAFNFSKIQYDFCKRLFLCWKAKKLQYFNMNGENVKPDEVSENYDPVFANESDFSNYKSELVLENGKVGVVKSWQSNGKQRYETVIPSIYDGVMLKKYEEDALFESSSDLYGVKIKGKWGFVNADNKIILPIEYDSVNTDLSSDLREKWRYDGIDYERILITKKDGFWGIIGKTTDQSDTLNTVLPFEFDAISTMYHSYLLVKKENKFQIFSRVTNQLISNKSYSSIRKYKKETVKSFELFEVTNGGGQTVYIGENGVEFFKD